MSKNEINSVIPPRPKQQRHVHEIQGSVEVTEVKKPYAPDCKNDHYYDEGKKGPCRDEYKKDPCYDYDKPKKDPCYDYDKPKKDPCYDYDKPKKDPCYDYDNDYEYDNVKKRPCYDYDEDEDQKDPYYDDDDERNPYYDKYKKDKCDKKDPCKHCPKQEGHNHRIAKVSGEAIPFGCKDHYHEVRFRTDFYEGHYHTFCGKTGGAIPVGDRHVHFLASQTSFDAGHKHDFRIATLIEDPIGK